MRAKDEIARLQRKLEDGSLPPDEPLFTLRAQDVFAHGLVVQWIDKAQECGTPTQRVAEAIHLANAMQQWRVRQIPGRQETRQATP